MTRVDSGRLNGNTGEGVVSVGRNRRQWLRSLALLLKGGVPSRTYPGRGHLLRGDAYVRLAADAVDAGCDLAAEEDPSSGRTQLLTLCERLATPFADCPEAPRVVRSLLAQQGRRGMDVLEVKSVVERCCWAVCSKDVADAVGGRMTPHPGHKQGRFKANLQGNIYSTLL